MRNRFGNLLVREVGSVVGSRDDQAEKGIWGILKRKSDTTWEMVAMERFKTEFETTSTEQSNRCDSTIGLGTDLVTD